MSKEMMPKMQPLKENIAVINNQEWTCVTCADSDDDCVYCQVALQAEWAKERYDTEEAFLKSARGF